MYLTLKSLESQGLISKEAAQKIERVVFGSIGAVVGIESDATVIPGNKNPQNKTLPEQQKH